MTNVVTSAQHAPVVADLRQRLEALRRAGR
jgi:hypothetical protein